MLPFSTLKVVERILTLVVLPILAALWAVVLLPPLLRSRSVRANDSIGEFNFRLNALGRTNGALRPGVPARVPTRRRAAQRRRDVLRALLLIVGVCGLLALATDARLAWISFGASACALAAFGALWAWARSLHEEQLRKVRAMPARRPRELPLRRAVSS